MSHRPGVLRVRIVRTVHSNPFGGLFTKVSRVLRSNRYRKGKITHKHDKKSGEKMKRKENTHITSPAVSGVRIANRKPSWGGFHGGQSRPQKQRLQPQAEKTHTRMRVGLIVQELRNNVPHQFQSIFSLNRRCASRGQIITYEPLPTILSTHSSPDHCGAARALHHTA